jgi:vitamin B12 transporter
MIRIAAVAFIVIFIPAAAFSEETHRLGTIVVTPSRIEGPGAAQGRSVRVMEKGELFGYGQEAIADAIDSISGTDIRRRGPEGVQADICIRGTTFEQNTILIDGIKINDPQTGHFDMDLPVTVADVDRVEILKGPASSLYGPNAFGGVINIITRKASGEELAVDGVGGSYDYYRTSLAATYPVSVLTNRFSIEESRSSGYMPETEFNILSLSDSARANTGFGDYDFFFGYTKKDFGADSFYSNLYSNEEEHTDTRFFKLDGAVESGPLKVMPKLFLRRHWDKFSLDRNRPGWQTNYSTSYDYGGQLDCSVENQFLDAAYGFELSRDTIDSTNLQTHSRTKEGYYLEVSPKVIEGLSANGGVRGDYFSGFGWQWSPSVNAGCRIGNRLNLRALAGRAYRIPTYTDLYYNDKANIGNSALRPESSWTYECGLDYRSAQTKISGTYFLRNTYDAIDWTRASSTLPWSASNIGHVETNGFELSLSIMPKEIDRALPANLLFLEYTALDSYAKHDYLSKYALDYLKQHITAGVQWNILGFENSWALNYKKRIGDSGYVVVDTKVTKKIIKKDSLAFEAFLEITNIFNVSYSEQSDIPMPGRWIKSGGRLRF